VLSLHHSGRKARTEDEQREKIKEEKQENEDETKKTRKVQKKNERITLKLKQLKYHA
jgi:hypothetical protein